MATERLSMRQIREILRQKWCLGQSHRAVAESLGIGSGTVGTTVLRARAAGLDWAQVESLTPCCSATGTSSISCAPRARRACRPYAAQPRLLEHRLRVWPAPAGRLAVEGAEHPHRAGVGFLRAFAFAVELQGVDGALVPVGHHGPLLG